MMPKKFGFFDKFYKKDFFLILTFDRFGKKSWNPPFQPYQIPNPNWSKTAKLWLLDPVSITGYLIAKSDM